MKMNDYVCLRWVKMILYILTKSNRFTESPRQMLPWWLKGCIQGQSPMTGPSVKEWWRRYCVCIPRFRPLPNCRDFDISIVLWLLAEETVHSSRLSCESWLQETGEGSPITPVVGIADWTRRTVNTHKYGRIYEWKTAACCKIMTYGAFIGAWPVI